MRAQNPLIFYFLIISSKLTQKAQKRPIEESNPSVAMTDGDASFYRRYRDVPRRIRS